MNQLDANMDLVQDYGWSVYVLPCMNPDGLIDGYTMNGPGRCTTTYLNRSGALVTGTGIDLNRSFPTAWTAYSSNRNFNGSAPLASKESAALAKFVQDVKGSATNLCIDTHGWYSQIITSNGQSSKLYQTFKSAFPGNSWANCNNGRGYFTAYTASLGYASCLFEFPDGLHSLGAFQRSGYCEKYCSCILDLLKAYGTYDSHLTTCASKGFTDVPRDIWYHDAMDYAVENGLLKGESSSNMAPLNNMSRAMLVTVLYRVAGEPAVEIPPVRPENTPVSDEEGAPRYQFYDVELDQWYTKAVYWAQENGIITGRPDGNFAPGDDVIRQDTALILYRFSKWEGKDVSATTSLTAYPDVGEVSDYAATALAWANAKGIIQGRIDAGTTTLAPKGDATRAEMATILQRYLVGSTVSAQQQFAPQDALVEPIYYDDGEDLGGN
jgi:hypothetical protein